MTDRIRHVTVTLDKVYRDDDIEHILNAIRQIRGVGSVTPKIIDATEALAYESVRVELEGKLYEAVQDVFRRDRKTGKEP